jgi:thiopeptide-type bacteriocin biosynthesis protein
LHRDGTDWTWLGVGPNGTVWARVPQNPILDQIIDVLMQCGHTSVARLAGTLADGDLALSRTLPTLLWRLIGHGLLRPAAAVPGGAPDVWEALDAVTSLLTGEFGRQWRQTVAALRGACSDLEPNLTRWSARQIRAHLASCDQIVNSLRRSVGLSDAPPGVVTVDAEYGFDLAPFRDNRYRDDARAAIAAGLSVAAVTGCDELYRRAAVEELAAVLPDGVPQPIEQVARIWDQVCRRRRAAHYRQTVVDPFDTYPGLFDRRFGSNPALALDVQDGCDAWEEWLASSWRQCVFTSSTVRASPSFGHGAALLVADGPDGVAFSASRPQPGAFHSRHPLRPRTVASLRAALSDTVEVVGRDNLEPGVGVRPELTTHRIDLTQTSVATGWHLTATADRRLWLVPGDRPDLRFTPVYNSAAQIGRVDPLSSLLFTAAMTHGWELHSVGCPVHPVERDVWLHQPEIRIASGDASARVSSRRWTLARGVATSIARSEGAQRFLEWRSASRDLDLPDVITLHGTDPETLASACVVSSVLSVDAAFDRRSPIALGGDLVATPVTHAPRVLTVADSRGRYVWEVGQPWRIDGTAGRRAGHDELVAAPEEPLDVDAALSRLERYPRTGANWLQINARLAGPSAWREIADLIATLKAEGSITSWWFVHKPPGVRLRLSSDDPDWLKARIEALRQQLRHAQFHRTGSYEPELDRFTGECGLELAHRHFEADSRMALSWWTGPVGPEQIPRLVGLYTAHTMFSRIADDAAENRDMWTKLRHAVQANSTPDPLAEPQLSGVIGRCIAGELPTANDEVRAIVSRAARWGRRIGDAAADLHRIEGLPMRQWAASVAVFHWNRWGLTAEATRPMVAAMLECLPER